EPPGPGLRMVQAPGANLPARRRTPPSPKQGSDDLDFRQLRYALAVYKERSFTKAAKRLNISQSAVSEQVKLLEDEIGFELFRRTSRGIESTERGRTFLY